MLLSNKGVEWNFLARALTLPSLSLSSLKVDKLTFQSAAKNLTHGLDLLSPSIYLLTTGKINKAAKETWFKSELAFL